MSGAQSGRDVKGKALSTSTTYFQCIRQLMPNGAAEIPAPFRRDFFAPRSEDLDCIALTTQPPQTALPVVFQDTYAAGSPWLFKGQISETFKSHWLQTHWGYSIDAKRYPLIHELTLHRVGSEVTREMLMGTIEGIRHGLEDGGDPQKARADLREARRLMDLYEKNFRVLEKWATQDGKDKAISREAALDTAFQLARANESLEGPDGEEKSASSRRLLWDTHKRRYGAPDSVPELRFGLAVIDLNVTAPNAVDRDLGDLVLETTYRVMKKFFNKSVVTRGTRTNFRIVNPDGALLTQEKLLELEKEIYERIAEKAASNGKWKKFVNEKYRVDLSAGYEEVKFEESDVKKNVKGEYERSTIIELLEKIDQAYRVASARSQEAVGRLKDAKNSVRTPRLNHGQFPIPDLNGIPEGRFFEPLEAPAPGAESFRLIHSLKRTFENFRQVAENLANLEWMISEAKGDPAKRTESEAKVAETMKLLDENRVQFHDIYYDISHDLRMPRMVDRPMVAERVDAIVGETGGARLLFTELGKFHSFVRAWYGGNQDKYVHELIYDFYKILTQKGLILVHPGNEGHLMSKGDHLALDPKSGKYFSTLQVEGLPPVQLLLNPRSGNPIASEGIVGMRDGDEIGFIVADRDANGRVVKEKTVQEVFSEFEEAVQRRGSMFFDDVEKVGPDKVRTPQWQLREYRRSKLPGNGNGKYVITEPRFQKLESEAVKNFTGLVVDYVGVAWEEVDPTASKENAKVVIGRRPRWRYFEGGKLSSGVEIYYGEPHYFSRGGSGPSPQGVPEELVKSNPAVAGKPILVKLQTTLTAGYVAVDFERGAELDTAWNLANNLSKKSKNKKGEPVIAKLKPNGHAKPPGYDYDRSVSSLRTEELGSLFGKYSAEKNSLREPRLSAELGEWVRARQKVLMELANPRKPGVFESSLIQSIRKEVKNPEQRDKLIAEVKEQTAKGGELIQLRDALIAVQVLEREGLSLNLKPLAPGLWTALSAGQEILQHGSLKGRLGKTKTLLVKLHVQQTGELPPPDILNEARKYVDPLSVFIPQEVYALAQSYRIAPEKVPYFVAGMKADKIRELGQEAFRSLTYEDLHRLVESPEGQAFLRDPKNALLLQDTLRSRVAYQGVPLLTAMLSVIPAEKISGYLAEKAGKKLGLGAQQVQELKFGFTLYFAHMFNITASGAWEVILNRSTAAKGLSEAIGSQVNLGILRQAKVAGQPLLQVGLRSGGGLGSALADGILEKWGISSFSKMGARGVAWHVAKSVPRVPFHMLRTMGAGYLASRLFDFAAGTQFSPDHPVRKYGGFVAFFLPDILRMTLGSSRIAASPLLRTTGGLFTRLGNRVLAIAIADFAFSKLFIKNDYERSVHKRVTDQIYDEDVFRVSLEKDWWVLPLVLKGARAGSRALAPTLMDWGVTSGNQDVKAKVLSEDLKNSQQMTEFWKNGLAKLLLHPSAYSPEDENSYRRLDLGLLTKSVELNPMEKRALETLSNCLGPVKEETLNFVPAEKMDEVLQRVFLFQLQQAAKFLVMVDQKENDWAREVFNADGTMKEGKGAKLLETVLPSKAGEAAPEAKLLSSRKIMVALALLDEEGLFHGQSISKTAFRADLTDVSGEWILNEEWKVALSLFAAQATESKDEKALEKLSRHVGRLLADYMKAPEGKRGAYLELFKCLGLNPELTAPSPTQ